MNSRNQQKYRPSEHGVRVYTWCDACQMLDWTLSIKSNICIEVQ
jgi:hypothetical protein